MDSEGREAHTHTHNTHHTLPHTHTHTHTLSPHARAHLPTRAQHAHARTHGHSAQRPRHRQYDTFRVTVSRIIRVVLPRNSPEQAARPGPGRTNQARAAGRAVLAGPAARPAQPGPPRMTSRIRTAAGGPPAPRARARSPSRLTGSVRYGPGPEDPRPLCRAWGASRSRGRRGISGLGLIRAGDGSGAGKASESRLGGRRLPAGAGCGGANGADAHLREEFGREKMLVCPHRPFARRHMNRRAQRTARDAEAEGLADTPHADAGSRRTRTGTATRAAAHRDGAAGPGRTGILTGTFTPTCGAECRGRSQRRCGCGCDPDRIV